MMRRSLAFIGLAVVGAVAMSTATDTVDPTSTPLYALASLKGKLVREEPAPEERLAIDSPIQAGDLLRTGWRSSAEIVSSDSASTFHLGSRTRVRLASERPGVLLEVEKGRLRAVFDKATEGPEAERIVVTPSAVLSVRGTEYGVAVSKSGDTQVVVFSGVVDVEDMGRGGTPVSVSMGEFCTIPRGDRPSSPMPHMMNAGDWDHGRMPGSMGGHGATGSMGGHGSGHSHGGGAMGHGG